MGLFGPPNVNEMKAKRDVKGLMKALAYKKDSGVRKAAATALGQIGSLREETQLALTETARDSNPEVAAAATVALGHLLLAEMTETSL